MMLKITLFFGLMMLTSTEYLKTSSLADKKIPNERQKRMLQIQSKIHLEIGEQPELGSKRDENWKFKMIESAYKHVKKMTEEADSISNHIYIANIGEHFGVGKRIAKFKIPRSLFTNSATVRLAKLCIPQNFTGKRLRVHVVVKEESGISHKKTCQVKMIDRSEKSWPCFHVTTVFLMNLGARIASRLAARQVIVKFAIPRAETSNYDKKPPMLLIESTSKGHEVKQRGMNCHKGNRHGCCRAPLKIRFSDIGYGHVIVAPKEFNAYRCKGKCGTFSRHMSTRVDIVKSYNSFLRRRKFPEPVQFCCTATKTSGLTVLIKDNNFMQSREIPGLVIEECGCD